MSAEHDKVLVAAAKAHGVRLANTCGAVVMRLVAANRDRVSCGGRLVHLQALQPKRDQIKNKDTEPAPGGRDESQWYDHPWGRLSVEFTPFTGDELVTGEGEEESRPKGVILSFVKAGSIAVSWSFYAGKGAWLLISCSGGDHHVVDNFTADGDLCRLQPPPFLFP